jgi:hypothetical protein
MPISTLLRASAAGAALLLGVAAVPGAADAAAIDGTATLNFNAITLNTGTSLANTSSVSVGTFTVVAETGNVTVSLGTSETGTTYDLTNLPGLSFPGAIDFTATGGHIVTKNATFLNIMYSGMVSAAGLTDTAGTLTVTFTDNSGTLGGSEVVAAFPTSVPAPASIAMLGAGLILLGLTRRRII